MHRDCYNYFIKGKALTDEIKNEIKRMIFHRKIAQGLEINDLIGFEDEIKEELENEIEKGTLDELYTEFLSGKKHGSFQCQECKQMYQF